LITPGFFGVIVTAQTREQLGDVDTVEQIGGTVDAHCRRPDGWQVVVLAHADVLDIDKIAEVLARRLQSPAAAAYVHDSDVAFIEGNSPAGTSWSLCAQEETAIDHEMLTQPMNTPDRLRNLEAIDGTPGPRREVGPPCGR